MFRCKIALKNETFDKKTEPFYSKRPILRKYCSQSDRWELLFHITEKNISSGVIAVPSSIIVHHTAVAITIEGLGKPICSRKPMNIYIYITRYVSYTIYIYILRDVYKYIYNIDVQYIHIYIICIQEIYIYYVARKSLSKLYFMHDSSSLIFYSLFYKFL